MQKDLTEIVVVLDRSGSMASCKTDAEGGLNTFIDQQKTAPGRANFTLIQFDDKYEVVCSGVDIRTVNHFTLVPRGWTALRDAVGKAITETGERLSKLPESERPGLVVVVIVTDGAENASTEYTQQQIHDMIKHQQEVYSWQFTFLAANIDAFAAGGDLGVKTSGTLQFSAAKSKQTYAALNKNVTRMRSASVGGFEVANTYTDDEREETV